MRLSELLNEDNGAQEWAQANKPEKCPKCGCKDSYRDTGRGASDVLKCAQCGKVHAERPYTPPK